MPGPGGRGAGLPPHAGAPAPPQVIQVKAQMLQGADVLLFFAVLSFISKNKYENSINRYYAAAIFNCS